MRILRINGVIADIDESTAIGIDFQAYSVSEPAYQKCTVSNNFSIPKTNTNLKLINYTGNPYVDSDFAYNENQIDYWVDNVQLIATGIFYISSIDTRINLIISQKNQIFTKIAEDSYKWNQFLYDFCNYGIENFNLGSSSNPHVSTSFKSILEQLTVENNTPFRLLPYLGNLAIYDDDGSDATSIYVENSSHLFLNYTDTGGNECLGGHFSIRIKSVFEYLESIFGISFSTSYETSIFYDDVASKMYVPARRVFLYVTKISDSEFHWWFGFSEDGDFLPSSDTEDAEDKTVFDLVKSFFQIFNVINNQTDSNVFCPKRFDTIEYAEIIDFSKNIKEVSKFEPIIENYKQTNYIKWASVATGTDEFLNKKTITVSNKNIETGSTDDSLFEIDGFISNISDGLLNLTETESFSTFIFIIPTDTTKTFEISAIDTSGNQLDATITCEYACMYDLSSEYNFLQKIVKTPKVYTIKKYVLLSEINNIDLMKRYRIIHPEINGLFFISKISSFNPEKTDATEITLIQI